MGVIFCVGLEKTGTTSLASALDHLNFTVWRSAPVSGGRFSVNNPNIAADALPECLNRIEAGNVFIQQPWAWLWEEWADRFPTARFILTVRDEDDWWRSNLTYFANRGTEMRRWVYGHPAPRGHEAAYRKVFRTHNQKVRERFAGSPRFLELDVCAGDGWKKLCPFVDRPVLEGVFPHMNKGGT